MLNKNDGIVVWGGGFIGGHLIADCDDRVILDCALSTGNRPVVSAVRHVENLVWIWVKLLSSGRGSAAGFTTSLLIWAAWVSLKTIKLFAC